MNKSKCLVGIAFGCATLASGIVDRAYGQNQIPVRDLPVVDQSSKDTLGSVISVRALSDGRILVNDPLKNRIRLCDRSIESCSTVQTFTKEQTSFALIPYIADSSLYLDPGSRTFVVLDREGKIARVMALPHPEEAQPIAAAWTVGAARIDPEGRLVYRGSTSTSMMMLGGKIRAPVFPDSVPLLRANFDSRKIDTIVQMRVANPVKMTLADDVHGVTTLTATTDPFDKVDQWAMLSDGTIAVVRANDYHVDWIHTDGTRHSADRMRYDWVHLSEADKRQKIDSIKQSRPNIVYDTPIDVTFPTQAGPLKGRQVSTLVSLNELSDYESALGNGAVMADQNGRLWILPRNRRSATTGLVYDIVGKEGSLVDRVRLPKDWALVGFGLDDTVFVARVEKGVAFLGKTRFK